MGRDLAGDLTASGLRIAVILGRFNDFLGESLLRGARDTFLRCGGDTDSLDIVRVPGSFEIPPVCRKLALQKRHDAIVALGVIVEGSTNHFDLVCSGLTSGIASISLETLIPVTFGVVTTHTIEQAIERVGTKAGNKGADAMLAAIEMATLFKKIDH
jgi:6,7-dimethyl-8-ribityllumazine synthase